MADTAVTIASAILVPVEIPTWIQFFPLIFMFLLFQQSLHIEVLIYDYRTVTYNLPLFNTNNNWLCIRNTQQFLTIHKSVLAIHKSIGNTKKFIGNTLKCIGITQTHKCFGKNKSVRLLGLIYLSHSGTFFRLVLVYGVPTHGKSAYLL